MAMEVSTNDSTLKSMYDYLKTGTFSDLTITCGDKTWNAHRVVVCSKSSFFRAACVGNFKEAATGVINLHYNNPMAVGLMMDYLNTKSYKIDEELLAAIRSRIYIHIQVHCLGDKYDIPGLCRLAASHYQSILEDRATFEEYLASIPEVYLLRASDSLRGAAVEHARRRLAEDDWSLESRYKLKQVMKDVPEFGNRTVLLEVSIDPETRPYEILG
ncbi:hypothetical protein V493_02906 [Pseudogymnoascus sp. VKM F-4281 (FW-2241)]|nr:hypothetical protein V493_02906 [Pseudogymnoascus sp. VKM F-4281 (FW-2241)]